MVGCVKEAPCSAEVRGSITELLVGVLPGLPLKLPQQRAWATACCVTTLQLCNLQEDRGEPALIFLRDSHKESQHILLLVHMPASQSSILETLELSLREKPSQAIQGRELSCSRHLAFVTHGDTCWVQCRAVTEDSRWGAAHVL